MSARDIAAAIGSTKGSVIGLYDRHRDKLADCPLNAPVVKRRKQTMPRGEAIEITARRARMAAASEPYVGVTVWPPAGGCKYAFGEGPYRFCGCPVERGSWCEEHRKVVFYVE